jgi:hypothetical protein
MSKETRKGHRKRSCNDDMILFIFHINEAIAFCGCPEKGRKAVLQGFKVSLQDIFRFPFRTPFFLKGKEEDIFGRG